MAKGRQKPVFDIDINDVYYQLHETAMENSKNAARAIGCVIMNTGVNEKGKSYFGSGQYDVQCVLDSEDKEYQARVIRAQDDVAKFKKSCFDVMKKYVEFFLSDAAEKMSEDQLIEVRAPKNETSPVKTAKPDLSESAKIDYRRSLVENLFNEATGSFPEPPLEQDEENAEKERSAADEKKKQELQQAEIDTDTDGGDLIGYRWRYDNVVAGRTPAEWKITGPRWAKNATSAVAGFVGGAVSKLAGVLGGVTVHTMAGDMTATAKGAVDAVGKAASLAGKAVSKAAAWASKYIDKDEFANAVYSNFRKDYPQSDVSEVRAYLSQSLENVFRQQKKLTSDLKKRLQGVEFPIVVQISPRSKDYANIDIDVVADEIKKSYGPWYKRLADLRGLKLAVSQVAKNIIKVSGVKSVYKIKSSYDQDLRYRIRQYALDATNTKSTVKQKKVSEADVESAVSGILTALFEEEPPEPGRKTKSGGIAKDFTGRAKEIQKFMTSREYRPYLDILFDGFMHDKRVSDKDVENKRLHEDPYLETILTHLANNGTDKTKIASADGVTSKEEFIHVLNYLTSPVNVPDLTDDDLKGKTPEEQEKMRKDQEDERARLTQDLDEAFYEFLAIYIGVTGPKSDAIYSSLHKMFGIIADFVEKHGNESNASDEYDMYVYFDSNIRDLEDEGGNG